MIGLFFGFIGIIAAAIVATFIGVKLGLICLLFLGYMGLFVLHHWVGILLCISVLLVLVICTPFALGIYDTRPKSLKELMILAKGY
jgi:hypothetical protein